MSLLLLFIPPKPLSLPDPGIQEPKCLSKLVVFDGAGTGED